MDYMEQAERLAKTYADPILRLSYTYLKNTHDAQDICQTVFVKLLHWKWMEDYALPISMLGGMALSIPITNLVNMIAG